MLNRLFAKTEDMLSLTVVVLGEINQYSIEVTIKTKIIRSFLLASAMEPIILA